MTGRGDVDVVLGVDIGTTATKVVAVAPSGHELASAAVAYPLLEPRPGQAVQDPDVVRAAVVQAVRRVAEQTRASGGGVAGLALSAAMHTLLALDGADRPLTPLLTWADNRAVGPAERLRAEHGPGLHRRTGIPPHSMSPLAKLVWFREQDPATFAAARRWVGIKEYVLAALCGDWLVDHSIASATGLLNLAALDWDGDALALAGLTPTALARLVPVTTVVPELTARAAAELGLPVATPIVVGAGDGPLANLGVGAVGPGVAACSIGTSGALRVMVDRPVADPADQLFRFAFTPGWWVCGGAINNGGAVLRWLRETVAPDLPDEAAVLDLAARAPAGCDGLLMAPYLLGERAPHWSELPRGAYVGLRRAHRREHLVRAALEGVCLQLAVVLDSVRAAGIEVGQVRATGGFARSPLWRQMLTDALDLDVGFPTTVEGSAVGAALLGLAALEMIDGWEDAARAVELSETRHPDPAAAATYRALLPIFSSLHDALSPAFRALRDLASLR